MTETRTEMNARHSKRYADLRRSQENRGCLVDQINQEYNKLNDRLAKESEVFTGDDGLTYDTVEEAESTTAKESISITMTRTRWLQILGCLNAQAANTILAGPDHNILMKNTREIGRQYAAAALKLDGK